MQNEFVLVFDSSVSFEEHGVPCHFKSKIRRTFGRASCSPCSAWWDLSSREAIPWVPRCAWARAISRPCLSALILLIGRHRRRAQRRNRGRPPIRGGAPAPLIVLGRGDRLVFGYLDPVRRTRHRAAIAATAVHGRLCPIQSPRTRRNPDLRRWHSTAFRRWSSSFTRSAQPMPIFWGAEVEYGRGISSAISRLGFETAAASWAEHRAIALIGCLLGTADRRACPASGRSRPSPCCCRSPWARPAVGALIMLGRHLLRRASMAGLGPRRSWSTCRAKRPRVVTCIDGNMMARQGRGGPALAVAALGLVFRRLPSARIFPRRLRPPCSPVIARQFNYAGLFLADGAGPWCGRWCWPMARCQGGGDGADRPAARPGRHRRQYRPRPATPSAWMRSEGRHRFPAARPLGLFGIHRDHPSNLEQVPGAQAEPRSARTFRELWPKRK